MKIPTRKKPSYDEFVQNKLKLIEPCGFNLTRPLNQKLWDWQQKIVQWGVAQGRCAFFEDCGLGKTPQQLEWAYQICQETDGDVLILSPLGVADQTVDEAAKFGIPITRCHEPEDIRPGIIITNYEMKFKRKCLIF